MASMFFVAVGGSGCKTLEAFIHLCAAGLGPDDCWVGLADQDHNNGHANQLRHLLNVYQKARDLLRPAGQDTLGSSTRLFATRLSLPPGDVVWQPLSNEHATLQKDIVNKPLLSENEKSLLGNLFSPEEQELSLNWGFRGRPNLGAATLAHAAGGLGFWKNLTASVTGGAKNAADVRVFFTASVCGGTGAAGFPTLSRMLKRDATGLDVAFGGALLLPYFSFPAPDDAIKEGLSADSAMFQEQSAAALSYYEHLMRREPVFDTIYLVGWDELISLPIRAIGGPLQRNPPLVPELYAALAASGFLSTDPVPDQPIQYTGRSDGKAVGWNDLPDAGGGRNLRSQLGQLLRFAQAYTNVYAPVLTGLAWKKVQGEAWFRSLLRGVDLNAASAQASISALSAYCREVLIYFASMGYSMGSAGFDLELVVASQFATPIHNDPERWCELREPATVVRDSARAPDPFTRLIVAPDGRLASSLSEVMHRLSHSDLDGKRKGFGVFVGALYDACALD